MQKIAILGAGLSGCVLAHGLQGAYKIDLFEKSRGAGGRMSTRRADPYQFDHGAQFFTARSRGFKSFLRPFMERGVVQEWQPRKIVTLEKGQKPYKRDWFEPHYVAAPRMNSLCKDMIASLNDNVSLHLQTHAASLERSGNGWQLTDLDGVKHGDYDFVLSSLPRDQVLNLLPAAFKGRSCIEDIQMLGCYALMLGFDELPALNWDIAKPKNSPISWMAINSNKPSREGKGASILIHSSNDWAEQHIEDEQGEVLDVLLSDFEALTGISKTTIQHHALHRWRYAATKEHDHKEDHSSYFDPALNIGVCGDWCIEGHVESAFLSAQSLIKSLS